VRGFGHSLERLCHRSEKLVGKDKPLVRAAEREGSSFPLRGITTLLAISGQLSAISLINEFKKL
jgi:hypothetical protein